MMDSDLELAIKLQNEWNNVSPETPPKKKRKSLSEKNNNSAIVDPQWETIDPNPDIHSLFQAFNKKYFWGKLDSVEVKWSPRMYSCAGICSYKGKWGGCVVSLSLPLLKLRPRKDLVETLLHEMIHAFLFVADGNRERTEHGPKFHEHMHRINKEAGTKITVYHTFHDEVKHYKQHWWRCNGPCQNQKPFFGLVKRSMNRAPGPNDFWFADHQARCGGEFIKVKEPEGFKSRKKTGDKTSVKNKKKGSEVPLAKYFPDVPKHSPPTNRPKPASSIKKGNTTKTGSPSSTLNNFFSGTSKSEKDSSIKTIKNENTSAKIDNYKKISNVHGFTNLSKPGSSGGSSIPAKKGTGFGGTGLKSNMGGTLLLNPRASTSKTSQNQDTAANSEGQRSVSKEEVTPFVGTGHVLGGSTGSAPDRTKSRLLSLYSTPAPPEPKPSTSSPTVSLRVVSEEEEDPIVHCPVCNMEMLESLVNDHLENCAGLVSVFENSATVLDDEGDPGLETSQPDQAPPDSVKCPVCGISSTLQDINAHLDSCLG